MAHADGNGVSFVPSKSFRSGERVRVRVPSELRIARGDGRISEFTTARIVPGFATSIPPGAPPKTRNFPALRSRKDLAPPKISSLVNLPGQHDGFVFLAPKRGDGQGGPMIVNNSGTPVWFKALPTALRATDFRVQSYQGKPVLTWWEGRARAGSGRGEGVIADASYRTIKRVKAANGFSADLHEFVLTGRDTALLMSYVPVRWNLGAVKGRTKGVVVDSVAQEVELSTGRVIFEWHSLDHIALSDTNAPRPKGNAPYDYHHINSLNLDADGGYVISARRTSSVVKVDQTGKMVWQLGGKSNTLKRGPGLRFDLQHDAVSHGDGIYTLFDNSAKGIRKASRAITVRIDEKAGTAKLMRSLAHPKRVLAATQGNSQLLAGGNTLVGWGSQGRISEFSGSGRLLLDLSLPKGYDTYRAYRFAWSGTPGTRPSIAATASGAQTRVYASWNGSTQTASWAVLAGPSADRLTEVASAPWAALETSISAATSERYAAVVAKDAAGAVLSQSSAIRVPGR
jgi:hypothetical protein